MPFAAAEEKEKVMKAVCMVGFASPAIRPCDRVELVWMGLLSERKYEYPLEGVPFRRGGDMDIHLFGSEKEVK